MIVAALAAACGDPAARVHLVPLGGDCARPGGATVVKVTAYAASGETSRSVMIDETVAIGDFPADTEQIGVEVFVGGGATGAAGKSAPLGFGQLADGAAIPVMMAPPDGLCELPAMTEPRAQPLVAPAGNGALVVGGLGAMGPVSTAEYYDAAAGTFAPVAVPPVLASAEGFTGAALAPLSDGRVALVGGPQHALLVFDPAVRAFVTDPTLIDARAFHAAIATGDAEVLLAGGCTDVVAERCGGLPRVQTQRYQLGRLSLPDPSAILAPGERSGARLFDLGIQLDGRRRYLLAGGSGGRADRFALDDTSAEVVPGSRAQAAALDGGAVLTAFDDDATAGGGAAVIAPGAAAAQPIAGAAAVQGARLIALEDGRAIAFGGDALGRVQRYDPTRDAWTTEAPASDAQTGPLTAPSLARLPDGAVLVVGGAVSPRAWLYRPSLVGPASGSVTAVPALDVAGGVLTAPDPATVTRAVGGAASWRLATRPGAAMAEALVGGPRLATGSISATVQVVAGGAALIAQQTGPGEAIVAELSPGSPPRLVRRGAGAARELCSGRDALGAFDPQTPVALRLAITERDARVSVGGAEVLACSVSAADRGAWGVASLGDGAVLAVATITVAR
jgi:hypothetical protein